MFRNVRYLCGVLQRMTRKVWWTTCWKLWRRAPHLKSVMNGKKAGDGHQEPLEVCQLYYLLTG